MASCSEWFKQTVSNGRVLFTRRRAFGGAALELAWPGRAEGRIAVMRPERVLQRADHDDFHRVVAAFCIRGPDKPGTACGHRQQRPEITGQQIWERTHLLGRSVEVRTKVTRGNQGEGLQTGNGERRHASREAKPEGVAGRQNPDLADAVRQAHPHFQCRPRGRWAEGAGN